MSNLQTYYQFKLDVQTVDQYTGASGLSKRRKGNQLQSLELPCKMILVGNVNLT